MKKSIAFINLLPLVIWLVYFGCSYYLGWMLAGFQILFLLGLPVLACIYNLKHTDSLGKFVVCNIIFLFSQVVGYCIMGTLHYNFISSDFGTFYITYVLSRESVIYIVVITVIGFIIKCRKDKKV